MKVIDVSTLGSEVKKLCEEASRGELIIFTNGEERLFLTPEDDFDEKDLDNDPELERELLKGLEGTPKPYAPGQYSAAFAKKTTDRTQD